MLIDSIGFKSAQVMLSYSISVFSDLSKMVDRVARKIAHNIAETRREHEVASKEADLKNKQSLEQLKKVDPLHTLFQSHIFF